VFSSDQFIQKLGCTKKDLKVKVVSIFGNTGDGKSHTLNQTFFDGLEVFRTSNEQNAYTLGVWVAFDPNLNVICLDTEGLVGTTTHENARTRLLLKVLAISDIVLYRSRSERLHRDMFTFLGSASETYSYYFQAALQAIGQREGILSSVNALGPSVIIFHETRHTRPLSSSESRYESRLLYKLTYSLAILEVTASRASPHIASLRLTLHLSLAIWRTLSAKEKPTS
jgi:zinc finger FYVE domain-containing protein 1